HAFFQPRIACFDRFDVFSTVCEVKLRTFRRFDAPKKLEVWCYSRVAARYTPAYVKSFEGKAVLHKFPGPPFNEPGCAHVQNSTNKRFLLEKINRTDCYFVQKSNSEPVG